MQTLLTYHVLQSHLDAKTSRRILDLAREQQEEEEQGGNEDTTASTQASSVAGPSRLPASIDEDDADLSEEEVYEDEDFGDEEYEELVRQSLPQRLSISYCTDKYCVLHRKLMKATKRYWNRLCQMLVALET